MQRAQGWTELGGVSVVIAGTSGSGSQRFQQSFRGSTITVYNTGTLTLSSIYSDDALTVKANPFTADTTTGFWYFYAANGTYDIKFSGGGISTPFTISAVSIGTDSAYDYDVASYATAGVGTSGSPWTGWDTATPWAANKSFFFRSGYFSFATSPNYLYSGITLFGEAGTILQHTGTGNAFVMDAGSTPGGTWIQGARVENLTVNGHVSTLTGTATGAISTTAVVGTSTLFLSEVSVGDAICFGTGMSTESQVVTIITDNTHLTVASAWTSNKSGTPRVGKSTNGFFFRALRNSTISNLVAKDVVNAGFYTEALVTNTFINPVCSYHTPTSSTGFSCRPQYGIELGYRGSDTTTTTTIINPVIEGMQSIGIYFLVGCYANNITGGTSEGNPGNGMRIDSSFNTIVGLDLESNSGTYDIQVNDPATGIGGARNAFINCVATGLVRVSGGNGHKFIGGQTGALTIDSAATYTQLNGVLIKSTFTDNGTSTISYGLQSDILGIISKTYINNYIPRVTGLTPDGSNLIATDVSLNSVFYVTLSANSTLSNPTNGSNGQTVTWIVAQDGTGGRTLSYGTDFTVYGGRELPRVGPFGSSLTIITATFSTSAGSKWLINDGPSPDANPTMATLTDSATVTWRLDNQQVRLAKVTLGGNRTLSIVNALNGGYGKLVVIQDNSGNRSLTLPSGSIVSGGGGGAVALTATGNAKDLLEFFYDGTNYYWKATLNFT